MKIRKLLVALSMSALLGASGSASAGKVFLTGHDPDFHAQDSVHAQNLLRAGLNYVTNGTYDDGAASKFLWVESRLPVPGGHRIGELGLNAIGLALGVNYDRANAADLSTVNFANYTAIVVASTFGGILSQAELDELIVRKGDIKTFINAGGGLFAMSECDDSSICEGSNVSNPSSLFAYLPVTVSSVVANAPFTVTPFGASLGLTDDDVNDPTHNSFGAIGGLNVVDQDSSGLATTLAGDVRITDTGFNQTPEPGTLAMLGLALSGMTLVRRRRR